MKFSYVVLIIITIIYLPTMYKFKQSKKCISFASFMSNKFANIVVNRNFFTQLHLSNKWNDDTIEYYNKLAVSHSCYDVKNIEPSEQKNTLKKEIQFNFSKIEETWDNNDIDYYHNLSVIHSKNN